MEDDFGQNYIQAAPSVSCVPYIKLVLHESLQQQGLGGKRAQVSATYMPVNLHAAWRFAHGNSSEDAEFSLTGDYRSERGEKRNGRLAVQFAREPAQIDICTWL